MTGPPSWMFLCRPSSQAFIFTEGGRQLKGNVSGETDSCFAQLMPHLGIRSLPSKSENHIPIADELTLLTTVHLNAKWANFFPFLNYVGVAFYNYCVYSGVNLPMLGTVALYQKLDISPRRNQEFSDSFFCWAFPLFCFFSVLHWWC